jgi:hypothetical protein
MAPFFARARTAFLAAACTTCLTVCISSLSEVPPAGATTGASKDSPYAAATDGGSPTASPVEPASVAGSVAPGTEKESPYAAAKDELALSFGPNLGKLWWLLLPTGLAAGSYLYLRSQEGAS